MPLLLDHREGIKGLMSVSARCFVRCRTFETGVISALESEISRFVEKNLCSFKMIASSAMDHNHKSDNTANIKAFKTSTRHFTLKTRWVRRHQLELIWAPPTRASVSTRTARSRSLPTTRETEPRPAMSLSQTLSVSLETQPRTR